MAQLKEYRGRKLAFRAAGAVSIFSATAACAGITNSWALAPQSTGDWFTPNNWVIPLVPGVNDNAIVNNGGTVVVSHDIASAISLTLGTSSGAGNLVVNNGGTLSLGTGGLVLGSGGITGSTVTQNGGMVQSSLSFSTGGGTYNMLAGSLSLSGNVTLGASSSFIGLSVVNLSGGSVSSGNLTVNNSGQLNITGGAWLYSSNATIASGVVATQTGGLFSGAAGTGNFAVNGKYNLRNDAIVSSQTMALTGSFSQTGGFVSMPGRIAISGGTYSYSGGSISAGTVGVGVTTSGALSTTAKGLFNQSSGDLNTASLTVSSGTYSYTGGTLEAAALSVNATGHLLQNNTSLSISNVFSLTGNIDFNHSAASIDAGPNATSNLAAGSFSNGENASVTFHGSDSFVIATPAQIASLGAFTNEGTTYTPGSTLNVAAGKTVQLTGNFSDHVVVAGTLASTAGGSVNLLNGVEVNDGGAVSLGSGTIAVNDAVSGIHGSGQLSAGSILIGGAAPSTFTVSDTASVSFGAGAIQVGNSSNSSALVQSGGSLTGRLAFGTAGGSFTLSGGSFNCSSSVALGGSSGTTGAVIINQSGGDFSASGITVNPNSQYHLNAGQISAGSLSVSTFSQTGGLVTGLESGTGGFVTVSGTYDFSGAAQINDVGLTVLKRFNAMGGSANLGTITITTGTLSQSGGAVAASNTLTINSTGQYIQSNGSLTTANTILSGTFQQSGGYANTGFLSVGSTGHYIFSGGSIQLGNGWNVDGQFDFTHSNVSIDINDGSLANSSVNLTNGQILNGENASVTIHGTDSFAILATGQVAAFGTFINEGTTYTPGQPLEIGAGKTVRLTGDFSDRVNVTGSLINAGGAGINLHNGAAVNDSGSIDIGGGTLEIRDASSGVFGTSSILAAKQIIVGVGTDGTFTIAGGTTTLTFGTLTLGQTSSRGNVIQTGGALSGSIRFVTAGSTYSLSDGTIASSAAVIDAGAGSASFTQTGGFFSSGSMTVGTFTTYTLDNGTLQPSTLTNSGTINMSGGTLRPSSLTNRGNLNITGGEVTSFGSLVLSNGSNGIIGAVTLSGGSMSFNGLVFSAGSFIQNTGELDVSGKLTVSGASATYTQNGGTVNCGGLVLTAGKYLQNGGVLNSGTIQISTGTFIQSNSTVSTGTLTVGSANGSPNAFYELAGGTIILQNGWAVPSGTMDFAGAPGTVIVTGGGTLSSLVDLRFGTIANATGATVNVQDPSAFVILPDGFDPAVQFGSFSNAGTTYTVGQPLVVPATHTVSVQSLSIADALVNNGSLTVTGGGSLATSSNLTNTGRLVAGMTSNVEVDGSLTNSGTIDLSGAANFPNADGSTVQTIRTQLATGYANGAWTGPGIDSTAAAIIAANPSDPNKTALGYSIASAGPILDGSPVSNSVHIVYTYSGDANLDGTVNASDFVSLAVHFNSTSAVWTDGDFNYDGKVNALDFNVLASNFGQSLSASPALTTLVPEPAVGVLGLMLLPRRRRNRQ